MTSPRAPCMPTSTRFLFPSLPIRSRCSPRFRVRCRCSTHRFDRLLRRHPLRGYRSDLPRQGDLLCRARTAPTRTLRTGSGPDPPRRRKQAPAIDGEPRPTRAHTSPVANRSRVYTATRRGDGASDPGHGRRAAGRHRSIGAVRPRLHAHIPAPGHYHLQLRRRPPHDSPQLKNGAAIALLSPGDGQRPLSRSTTPRTWRLIVGTAQLVAGKATARDDGFASALLAIRDDDSEALTHGDRWILYSLTFADARRPTI